MKIRRTIPPAAAPVSFRDILRGLYGLLDRRVIGEFEQGLRTEFGVEHVFLVSSGRAALTLILSGLRSLSGRKKVILPAYTCYSVPSAVVKAELEIVLCDVNPDTLDFDYEFLERILDGDTLCVVPTHLFGIPSDIARIRALTAEKGIYIVEDAAQSMGARIGEKQSGTVGDVGFFSLGRGKNVTCGSGGIILTSSGEVARSIRSLSSGLKREPVVECLKDILEVLLTTIFIDPSLYWFPSSLPFLGIGETRFDPHFPIYRMSGFKAGLMGSWRSRLERSNRCRENVALRYMTDLGLRNGKAIYSAGRPFVRFPFYGEGPVFKERVCRRHGHLGISPMYPASIDNIGALCGTWGKGTFRGAETIARSLLTLPTHELLKERDISEICVVMREEAMRPDDVLIL